MEATKSDFAKRTHGGRPKRTSWQSRGRMLAPVLKEQQFRRFGEPHEQQPHRRGRGENSIGVSIGGKNCMLLRSRLMNDRRCRYCGQLFQTSPFRPQQAVCSQLSCKRQRQHDYHRQKIASDPVYRQVCLESPRKWRAAHPQYWKQYRQDHPSKPNGIASGSTSGTQNGGWCILQTTTWLST